MSLFTSALGDPFFPNAAWQPPAEIRPPASKSLTNRLLVLAALTEGSAVLKNPLVAEDSVLMIRALKAAGLNVNRGDDLSWSVEGAPLKGGPREAPLHLDLENAGTAVRFLTGLCALHGEGWFLIDGSERMRHRPLEPLVEALRTLGVKISYLGNNGCPPVLIQGAPLQDMKTTTISGQVSSQYISSLMMAGCGGPGLEIRVLPPVVSRPYIAMTARLMARQGAAAQVQDGERWLVPAGTRPAAGTWSVEADASSATYPLAAAVLAGREVAVRGVPLDSLQGDTAFLEFLDSMGAVTAHDGDGFHVQADTSIKGTTWNFEDIPDTAMTAAVLAAFAEGESLFTGLSTLRVKETDRVAALALELQRLGAGVQVRGDDLHITPRPGHYRGVVFDTYKDHRMAMALSLCSLRVSGCGVKDPGCVAKSWPAYFQDMGMA